MSHNKYEELLAELKEANEEIERLTDENESLWFMLDEIKKADEALMNEIVGMAMGDLVPKIEA